MKNEAEFVLKLEETMDSLSATNSTGHTAVPDFQFGPVS